MLPLLATVVVAAVVVAAYAIEVALFVAKVCEYSFFLCRSRPQAPVLLN